MGKIITPTLPHNLPENWTDNQYVSPGGTEVGLTPQHGFNYLMKQVNDTQIAVNELDQQMPTTAKEVGAVERIIISKNIPTSGWCRIGTFKDRTTSHVQVFIGGSFNTTNPVPFVVDVYHRYDLGTIIQRPSLMNATAVTKVRMIQISQDTYAVDVYYNLNSENQVQIELQYNGVSEYVNGELVSIDENSGTVLSTVTLTKGGVFADGSIDEFWFGNARSVMRSDQYASYLVKTEEKNSIENNRHLGVYSKSSVPSLQNALKFAEVIDGNAVYYNIFGEHNVDLLKQLLSTEVPASLV